MAKYDISKLFLVLQKIFSFLRKIKYSKPKIYENLSNYDVYNDAHKKSTSSKLEHSIVFEFLLKGTRRIK